MEWKDILAALGIPGVLGTLGGAYLVFRGKRGENKNVEAQNHNSAIGDRWDDAVGLSSKMQEYITSEVEKQVAPIRERLAVVEAESHEMNSAFRTYAVQNWLWDSRGRLGSMPMLPLPILHRLGIGHLTANEDLEDTLRVTDIQENT